MNSIIHIKRWLSRFLNKALLFVLNPKNFINSIRDSVEAKSISSRNQEIKNKYQGKRCFVIGNGSSLNRMDLKKLENEYTFVVNNFIVHKDFQQIKPKFYVNIEPINILDHLYGEYFHPDNYYRLIEKTVKDTHTTLFFRTSSSQFIHDKSLFKNNKVYYINSGVSILLADKYGYEDDLTREISFCDSVIPSAICTAFYMGFREIYLIGCDEDYFFKKKDYYFYKNNELMIQEFKEQLTMEELAYRFSLSFKRWRLLRDHFMKKGVKIINAGVGGELDVFPRASFDKLFSK